MAFKISLFRALLVSILLTAAQQSGAAREMQLDSQSLHLMTPQKFAEGLTKLQEEGYSKIIFSEMKDGLQKVATTDQDSAGDFFFMLSFPGTDDQSIRRGEFENFYKVAKYLSSVKFRIIINLHAGLDDLRSALRNSNPTVIYWGSHGSPKSFYSYFGPGQDSGAEVPAAVFDNVSPTVYQFFLAACFGEQSFSNYAPYIPKTMTYFRWSNLLYPPTVLNWMLSGAWNLFQGHPSPTREGLRCQMENGKYRLVSSNGTALPGNGYLNWNDCYVDLFNARNGFICSASEDKYETFSIAKMEKTLGSSYYNRTACHNRLKTSNQRKMCRANDQNVFYIIDSQTNTPQSIEYKSMKDCISALFSEKTI
jgi:hypothetical protein